MQHIKLYEEELTKWTGELFDLITIIELFYYNGDARKDVKNKDIISSFQQIAENNNIKVLSAKITKNLQITRIIFKVEGKYTADNIIQWFPLENPAGEYLSIGLETHEKIMQIRWNHRIKLFRY